MVTRFLQQILYSLGCKYGRGYSQNSQNRPVASYFLVLVSLLLQMATEEVKAKNELASKQVNNAMP